MNLKRMRFNRYSMLLLERHRLFSPIIWATRRLATLRILQNVMIRRGAMIFALLCLWLAVSTKLDDVQQTFFSLFALTFAWLVGKVPGRLVTQVLVVLSFVASTRYMYWRVTESMFLDNWSDFVFGIGLFCAEIYAWIVLALGFFQTAWPLERKPVPLPPDVNEWPTVDIFIPTYNEPLKVVKPTVLAALAIDWPIDKIKVYILDDGKRSEFADFAKEIGVTHLTRNDSAHAKAGNINRALTVTNGDYVAIFDCDHIPTRTFLQVCMGWFFKDKKLVMMQTPHHFFSPDPFEKNLATFKKVPNEGELFYGLLQDGNDLWNATFFCGSCAIINRKALLEVGGIAVETVTEDAHTALKLHRLGYNTAYLAIPQAAGFATESLSGHVGQRIRWARGMAQIFRVDNPFLGKGLKIEQRLCYANAMLHFFYGLPRIVFLTAPLSFLFFGAHVISASAVTIALYALPHLIHSSVTNSRMQGDFRNSFWAEVYESVLAWYILRPTLVAVINPKLGKFNVTAKGGLNSKTYFDWDISRPYIILLSLNILGLIAGFFRFFILDVDEFSTILLNVIWTVYNVIMLGASLAVANEAKQLRANHRVQTKLPVTVRYGDSRSLRGFTLDYSEGGVAVLLPKEIPLAVGDSVQITMYRGEIEYPFKAKVTLNTGQRLGLAFEEMSMDESANFIQCTFARGDSWTDWTDKRERDSPMRGLREVLKMGIGGLTLFAKIAVEQIGTIGQAGPTAPAPRAKLDFGDGKH